MVLVNVLRFSAYRELCAYFSSAATSLNLRLARRHQIRVQGAGRRQ
jgi:hypothetical protein